MPPKKTPAAAPAAAAGAASYAGSDEHLWDELKRVDQLVRAQTKRWQQTVADTKPDQLWGMLHVTDAEVDNYLKAAYVPPDSLPDDLAGALQPFWDAAAEQAKDIAGRLAATPDRSSLRLARLVELYGLRDVSHDALLLCLLPEVDGRYRRLLGYLQDDVARILPTVDLLLQILYPIAHAAAPGHEVETARAAFDAGSPLLTYRLLALDATPGSEAPLSMRSVRIDDRIAGFLLGSNACDARLAGLLSPAGDAVTWDQLIVKDDRLAELQDLAAWWQITRQAPAAAGAQDATSRPAPAGPQDSAAPKAADKRKGKAGAKGQGTASAADAASAPAAAAAADTPTAPAPVSTTIYLHGAYGTGRRKAAQAFCQAAGVPLLIADVRAALRSSQPFEMLVDLCYREAALGGAALYWAGCEALLAEDQPPARWSYLTASAEAFAGLTFLASEEIWEPAGRFLNGAFLRLNFPVPSYDLRLRLWQRYLPPDTDLARPLPDRELLAESLANSFQMSEGQIIDAVAAARELATQRRPARPLITADDLFDGCRRQSGRRLITFARRLEPRTDLTFGDLILPDSNCRQLEELRERVRLRSRVFTGLGFERRMSLGQGLIALLVGSPGTGKTMAAELLAREQRVDLYKVDLSAVVSKYVGDTEKNLSRVFAEAENANAIIFFDEADALFGKRGEVKEARDRWANIEVNYLLQRVEEYRGVVILATNLRQNMDEAFLRRIHIIVEFPFPETEFRYRIWLGMFPQGILRPPDADICTMAERFRLPGGSIRNIVLDAAFRALGQTAADAVPEITLRHLAVSTAREYQKLNKTITIGEFGAQFYQWISQDILLNVQNRGSNGNG